MEKKTISLWQTPPYVEKSGTGFSASMDSYIVNEKKTAVIVCPGGGYEMKASGYEGEDVAKMLNENGFNAFVLDYSVKPCHKFAPLSDLQRAIRTARSLGFDKVGVLGFSAGGHLICTGATQYDFQAYEGIDEIDELSARPDVFIPCYPVVSFTDELTHIWSRRALLGEEWEDESLVRLFSNELNVTSDTPPCFLWHTVEDQAVSVRNSLALCEALAKNGVYFEAHIFPSGSHGLGLALDKNDVSQWSRSLCVFLSNLEF